MDLTGITFDQTVPRALVDRGDATTVLITSFVKTGNRVTAGAVWPRLAGYYRLLDEQRHDPLLVLETFRQTALLLAHVVDGVPLATMQIMRETRFEADLDGLKVTDEPTELVATVEVDRQERAAQSIMQTRLRFRLYRDGGIIGTGEGRAIIPPADRYLRVRGRDPQTVVIPDGPPGPGVPARAAGRVSDRDVVIAPGDHAGGYRLRIDARHPNFFDNPTDHTPGMLLIEAMRQAVVVESGHAAVPLEMAARFHRFVEYDHPGEVMVRRTATGFRTTVRQFDKLAAVADWRLAGGTDG